MGLSALEPLVILSPIVDLLAMGVPCSLGQSASIYAARNVSKNQLVAANIYFAHYFLVSLAWSAIVFVLFFAFLQSFFASEIIGFYLLFKGAIGSFTSIFTRSLTPFLKSESRYFVVLVRDCAEQLMFIAFLINCYINN